MDLPFDGCTALGKGLTHSRPSFLTCKMSPGLAPDTRTSDFNCVMEGPVLGICPHPGMRTPWHREVKRLAQGSDLSIKKISHLTTGETGQSLHSLGPAPVECAGRAGPEPATLEQSPALPILPLNSLCLHFPICAMGTVTVVRTNETIPGKAQKRGEPSVLLTVLEGVSSPSQRQPAFPAPSPRLSGVPCWASALPVGKDRVCLAPHRSSSVNAGGMNKYTDERMKE